MWVIHRVSLDKDDYLVHHGIKGQKWGKQNGPPYPLDYNDHSKAEKKLNPKVNIDGDASTKRKQLAKKIGKTVLISAGVMAVGALTYSAIKSGKLDSVIDSGKRFVDKSIVYTSADKSKLGKSFKQINSTMVKSINSDISGTAEGSINCFHTTTAYVLNSLFGKNVKALGVFGVDESSGLVASGRDFKLYKAIFNNIEFADTSNKSFDKVFSELKAGSTGILHVGDSYGSHFVNYEKDRRGKVTIVDPQRERNRIIDGEKWKSAFESMGYSPLRYIDFSNAALSDNAEEILKYIVK